MLKYGIKRRVDDVTKSCHKSYTYILALPKPSLAGGTSLRRRRRQRCTVIGGSIKIRQSKINSRSVAGPMGQMNRRPSV